MHTRAAGFLLVLASACSHAGAPSAEKPARHNRLVAIDLVGTTQITRDFAHSILKRLAGKDLGARSYEAWVAWVAQHSTSP